MDSYTLTEVLRLHILAAGARCSDTNARFRYQQRGGFTSTDDPGLEFRRSEVALVKRLGERSLYDLDAGEFSVSFYAVFCLLLLPFCYFLCLIPRLVSSSSLPFLG